MIVYRMRSMIPLVVAIIITITVLAVASGASAAVPVKLTFTSQFGREVNLTETEAKKGPELEDICTVASKDECKTGIESGEAGGFRNADSVAVAPNGNIYVADRNNRRVQELTANGQFVLMFGKEVNQTAVEAHGSEAEQGICTAPSKDVCKEGVESSAPGQFYSPCSMAIDPANGDVYVAEVVEGRIGEEGASGERVQKFTPEGKFLLEIGELVNAEGPRTYVCTHVEEEKGVKCTGPALRENRAGFTPEEGSFNFEQGHGNLLAVGAGGKLYVGDVGRVQEFTESGEFSGEVVVASSTVVDALALDASGDLYLTSHAAGSSGNVVREFEAKGTERSFEVKPEVPGAEVQIHGLAVDSAGHLAVAAIENSAPLGSLYEAGTGTRLTAFRLPESDVIPGIAFNAQGQLYVASEEGPNQEILSLKRQSSRKRLYRCIRFYANRVAQILEP